MCFFERQVGFFSRFSLNLLAQASKLWLVRFGEPCRISSTIYRLNMIEPSWHIDNFCHVKIKFIPQRFSCLKNVGSWKLLYCRNALTLWRLQHDSEAAGKSGWPSKKRKRVDWMHRRTAGSLAACLSQFILIQKPPDSDAMWGFQHFVV